jgi:hypothetical protein
VRVGRGRRRRHRPAITGSAAALVTAVVLGMTACIGTTDRERFDEIIRERGGGVTDELGSEAVAAIAAEAGVADGGEVEVRSFTLTPATRTVTAEVRDPDAPENLDTYLVVGGDVDSVTPVRVSVDDDLDAATFRLAELPLDRLEDMADAALAAFDQEGAYVATVSADRVAAGDGVGGRGEAAGDGAGGRGEAEATVALVVDLESPRAQATATFDGRGELQELTPL